MGSMRFRRSKKVGPFRVNLTKSGVGISAGVPGARVSVYSSGRVTKTVGIPGTGLYYRDDKIVRKAAPVVQHALRKGPPAGWYPNPEDGTTLRRWDGASWTSETSTPAQGVAMLEDGWFGPAGVQDAMSAVLDAGQVFVDSINLDRATQAQRSRALLDAIALVLSLTSTQASRAQREFAVMVPALVAELEAERAALAGANPLTSAWADRHSAMLDVWTDVLDAMTLAIDRVAGT